MTREQEILAAIEEIENSWPAHSPPPGLLQQLEDLEDELAAIREEENHAPEGGSAELSGM